MSRSSLMTFLLVGLVVAFAPSQSTCHDGSGSDSSSSSDSSCSSEGSSGNGSEGSSGDVGREIEEMRAELRRLEARLRDLEERIGAAPAPLL